MIKIGKPFVYEDNEYAYLKARINISDDTSNAYLAASKLIKKVHWRTSENYPPAEWSNEDSGLWFAVPKEYKQYLCEERSDAFVVALLWYAMITGSDIESVSPLSERMVFLITTHLIPALCTDESGYRKINIYGPTTNKPYKNIGGIGTGMSCGVDSIYTLNKYRQKDIPSQFRLTHLTYYNMGAIFHPNRSEKKKYTLKDFYETTDRMSEEKRENAKMVADKENLSFIYVKSNLDSDYYRGAYGHTGVYRNCAMTLALQGLFSIYYCSSGGSNRFEFNLTEGSQRYELVLCYCFSTEGLQFLISDHATRIEKIINIADYPIAQKFLDVCFCFNNCGKCSKCKRTLLTLDILGKLDKFGAVFNIDDFKKRRTEAYTWLLATKDGDVNNDDYSFAMANYSLAVKNNKIPIEAIKMYEKTKKKNVIICKLKKCKKGIKQSLKSTFGL